MQEFMSINFIRGKKSLRYFFFFSLFYFFGFRSKCFFILTLIFILLVAINYYIFCDRFSQTNWEVLMVVPMLAISAITLIIAKLKSRSNHTDVKSKQIKDGLSQDEMILTNDPNYNCWLDCIVDEQNRRWYIMACGNMLGLCLHMGNLNLTRACLPIFVFKVFDFMFLLPWDCTDAYYDSQYGNMFVMGVLYWMVAAFLAYQQFNEVSIVLWIICIVNIFTINFFKIFFSLSNPGEKNVIRTIMHVLNKIFYKKNVEQFLII